MTKIGILVGSLRKESFLKKLRLMLQRYSLTDMKQNLSNSEICHSIIRMMIMKIMFWQTILHFVTQ